MHIDKTGKQAHKTTWFLYIIEANDQSLYTGITTNVNRRFSEHQKSRRGARYFNGRKPVAIRYVERCEGRSDASKREYQIKALSAQAKRKLIAEADQAQIKYWQSLDDI